MDWWNDLTDWTASDDGWRVISGAIIPFVAIVVAGIVAALIGRGAAKRVVAMQERESRNAAVAAVISAARKAATWGSLGHDERGYADHLAEDADIRLRLLPVTGAPLAANWAQHEIADIKKNSSTFSFQADQSLADFRDRLLEWQARPSRARKLFKSDLERWKFDAPDPDAELIARQQDWNADKASGRQAPAADPQTSQASTDRPTPTTTSLRPAPQRQQAPADGNGAVTAAVGGGVGTAGGAGAVPIAPAGYSVSRGAQPAADPNATIPISDSGPNATRAYGAGATRPYGDDATTPVDSGAAIRPPLGSPVREQGDDVVRRAADDTAHGRNNDLGRDADDDATDVVDDAPSSSSGVAAPARVAEPTSADAHVNRSSDGRAAGIGGAGTSTTSIPTRIADAPAEPADANETSEAPYTQPISASELRRRSADEDE